MNMRRSQAGNINILLVPLILVSLFFIGAAAFGYWAFSERQDYKLNSDKKAADAADQARKQEDIIKDKAFIEAEKNPLTSYDGPEAYGSIHVEYPKTWSVYINSNSSGNQALDAYFNPRVVPALQDQSSSYFLRVQVLQQSYKSIVSSFNTYVKNGAVSITPYSLPKVPDVVGIRVDGVIRPGKKNTGSMVIFPIRDKSIEIWTDNAQAISDFNNIILPHVTFAP